MDKINIASVFSGIGSFEYAFKKDNILNNIIFACDNDKFCKESYMANYDLKDEDWYGDIKTLQTAKYKGQVDILCGGSPCQSFSVLGKRKGFEDERGQLFFDFARVIKEVEPKVFIFENVRNLLSHNKGKSFDIVLQSFKDLGYDVHYQTLNALDYGIPQKRDRLFIVGFKNKTDYEFPNKIVLDKKVKDFLEKDVEEKYYISDRLKKTILSSGTKNFHQTPTIDTDIAKCITASNGKYPRAGSANYVTTNNRLRRLTPLENLRLMGFDENFNVVVSNAQIFKQTGNAMVVNVIQSIIKNILASRF